LYGNDVLLHVDAHTDVPRLFLALRLVPRQDLVARELECHTQFGRELVEGAVEHLGRDRGRLEHAPVESRRELC
jgi:hypothetical protein